MGLQQRQRGYVLLVTLVFFASMIMTFAALADYLLSYARSVDHATANEQALALAEAGIEKAVYALNQNSSYAGESDTALGAGTFSTTISTSGNIKRITASGYVPNRSAPLATRIVKASVSIGTSQVSFHYGVQAGQGGFSLGQSSSIIGNAFAIGPIIGDGKNTACGGPSGNGNCIYGDVISAGPSGLVYGIHATGTVYAHTIGDPSAGTTAEKDVHYTSITNTTVFGISFPGSSDQATAPFPISDAQIQNWENQAAAGGVISACDGSGNYTITSNMTLGPLKIACNLVIGQNGTLTVAGYIWVVGNLSVGQKGSIVMSSSLSGQNTAIIADNPANSTGSGVVSIGQGASFQGSGAGSYVFLISQNNSAEQGGSTVALSLGQGSGALVAYAMHGLATLGQSTSVKEVTAYKIALSQSASVSYETGLASSVFQSGPGGSWQIVRGSYVIVQ